MQQTGQPVLVSILAYPLDNWKVVVGPSVIGCERRGIAASNVAVCNRSMNLGDAT
jgi:hypothetical protein